MCNVLRDSIYLPAARCFALVPIASLAQHTAAKDGAEIDYDATRGAVRLTSSTSMRCASQLAVSRQRTCENQQLAVSGHQEWGQPAEKISTSGLDLYNKLYLACSLAVCACLSAVATSPAKLCL